MTTIIKLYLDLVNNNENKLLDFWITDLNKQEWKWVRIHNHKPLHASFWWWFGDPFIKTKREFIVKNVSWKEKHRKKDLVILLSK